MKLENKIIETIDGSIKKIIIESSIKEIQARDKILKETKKILNNTLKNIEENIKTLNKEKIIVLLFLLKLPGDYLTEEIWRWTLRVMKEIEEMQRSEKLVDRETFAFMKTLMKLREIELRIVKPEIIGYYYVPPLKERIKEAINSLEYASPPIALKIQQEEEIEKIKRKIKEKIEEVGTLRNLF